MVCHLQNRSCQYAGPHKPKIVSLQLQHERIAQRARFDKDLWRSRSMNSANYKTEYERRDRRLSFIEEIITCVCIISFPRVLFSKLISCLQLAINAIYICLALARLLINYLAATQLAGETRSLDSGRAINHRTMGG